MMLVYTRYSLANAIDMLCFRRTINAMSQSIVKHSRLFSTFNYSIYKPSLVEKQDCSEHLYYPRNIFLKRKQHEHTINYLFSSSAISYGGKKSKTRSDKPKSDKTKSAKTKSKSSSIDDILDELSDDEDDETFESSNRREYQGERTPAFLFVEGITKSGANKGNTTESFRFRISSLSKIIDFSIRLTYILLMYSSGKVKNVKGSHVDYLEVMDVMDFEMYWSKLDEVINNQRHFFVQHINVR